MKKLIRLTESDLHRIIEGAVKHTINEIGDTYRGQYMLGRLAGRKYRNDGNDPEGWEEMQKNR